ncbi:hypothetical protein LSH36_1134g02071 [Paralvinella palmiformis]|uniref:Reverse transcriptase domain-containing protein n=1 Tax=Paralvinella palmiformis TaxID=53620 RepID=A0AAD9IVT5_9ANNE|nr:hypothetical protein LSH36_1134g02071 [Paralvinella palmiformis]
MSTNESVMPLCWKRATITPLLNRSGLDKEDIKNHRPIYKLPFISKLIENAVARLIEERSEHSDLRDNYQAAYRRGHSTETALTKVYTNIAETHDEGSMTALIKLDLSAAFDVINNPILLKRSELSFSSKEMP